MSRKKLLPATIIRKQRASLNALAILLQMISKEIPWEVVQDTKLARLLAEADERATENRRR